MSEIHKGHLPEGEHNIHKEAERLLSLSRLLKLHAEDPLRDYAGDYDNTLVREIRNKFQNSNTIREAVAAYSEFDKMLREERKKPPLKESKYLYDSGRIEFLVCASNTIADIDIILEKIKKGEVTPSQFVSKKDDVKDQDLEEYLKTSRVLKEWNLRIYELEAAISLFINRGVSLSENDRTYIKQSINRLVNRLGMIEESDLNYYLPKEKRKKIIPFRDFVMERLEDARGKVEEGKNHEALVELEKSAIVLSNLIFLPDAFMSYRRDSSNNTQDADQIINYHTEMAA